MISTDGTLTFTTTGSGNISFDPFKAVDDRKPFEKLFQRSEEQIYKDFGLIFKESNIKYRGEMVYEIESDHEAELYLIKKGFVKYVKGKKVWNDQALEEGWKNGWTPLTGTKAKNNTGKGHVYFVKSNNFHKIGSSSAANIQRRIKYQKPMEILAVSPKIENYRKLEKELHHHFASKRVLKYEVFENLDEADIEYIMNKLGNGINIKL